MYKTYILLILINSSFITVAQSVDSPAGLYYKTGGDYIDRWYQVIAAEGQEYAITDMYGRGFDTDFNDGLASIVSDNQITVASENGNPTYNLSRTAQTDSTFPLTADRLFNTNPLFNDDWDIVELLLNPVTGEVLPQFDGSLEFLDVFTLEASQQSIRFTDSRGTYFQGAMISSDELVIKLLKNPRVELFSEGPYASIPGSDNNFRRDMLGSGSFTDINHFEVILALHNYTPNFEEQFLLKISGSRINPLPPGDVNGDRIKNATDLEIITAAIGQVKNQDDGFNIASDLNADGLIDGRDVKLFQGESITSQPIDSSMTALWYDPSHDGEGWDLQILNSQTAHLSWFTFNELGEQMWATGLGTIKGNEINFPQLTYGSQGTQFGENFDPNEIVMSDWGSVNIYFESCNEAGLSYSNQSGFGHGGLEPVRIINHSGLDCSNRVITPTEINRFTGLWYDPEHDGEGWMIQVSNTGVALISWYTYDENAQPMWVVGSGTVVNNVMSFEELLAPIGAVFGDQFNPNDVQRIPWGTLTFTLDSCNQGTLNYNAIKPELGSGTLKPVRLASVAELGCEE